MKKLIALLLAGAMCAGLLAGCGGNNGGNTETKAPETSAPVESGDAAIPEGVGTIDPVNEWDQYNALIDEIKSTTDLAHRVDLMHQAEDLLMSTGAILPLYYYTDPYMAKEYLTNFHTNPYGFKFFQFTKKTDGSDTARLYVASEPDKLDPALNSTVDGAILAITSFAGLFTYDASGAVVPDLVESYEVSEDGLTYTFKMLPDLKWSNGDKLDANDFVYSWNRVVNPKTAADYAYMMDVIAKNEDGTLKVTASEDGSTLTAELVGPCPYFLDLCAFPCYFPVHQASVEAADPEGSNPGAWALEAGFVSNGAFTLTDWQHESSMTYTKNPNYHRAADVSLAKIQFMLSSDEAATYSAYQAGDLDFIDSIPTDEMENAKQSPEYTCAPQLGNYYVCFNVTSKVFDGKTPAQANAMRQAFALLVDREYLIENLGKADQVPASTFIPDGMADGNGGVFKDRDYFDPLWSEENVEKARELLKFAGYEFTDDGMLSDATPINLEYLVNTPGGNVSIGEALAADFSEIGINMTIKQEEWNVFLNDRKAGNFDIARNGWVADFNDPINMLEMWSTDSGNNDVQFGRYDGWQADFGVVG